VLRLYLGDLDPPTLDPNAAEDSQSISVLSAVHRGLLYFDDQLGTVPALADLPEITNDGKTLTFTLVDGAMYSDGTPIVAGDLVFSWRRLVTPSLANPYAYLLCPVVGVDQLLAACGTIEEDSADDALAEQIGVSAPDDKTFVVELNAPSTFFNSIVTLWPTVPIKAEWVNTPNFVEPENYIASGPFTLGSWAHNSEIVLVPNPNWYGDPPTLQEVRLQIGGDPDAAMAAYERGDLDIVTVPGTQLRRVLDDPAFEPETQQLPQLAITYYGFATCQRPADACPPNEATSDGRSPSSNLNFRIAMTQAVDKQLFIDLTFGGTGLVANSMIMPGLAGHDPDYDPYPFDLEAANERMNTALEELGVQDGPDEEEEGEEPSVTAADLGRITIGYNSNAGHLPRVAFLAEAWRTAFGMTEEQFEFVGVDFSTFLQQRTQGVYDVSRNGWGADFPHAHNQLDGLFTCGSGNNDEQYCNEDFDALINQAAAETDPDTQAALYTEAQRLLIDDAPVVWLRFGETTSLVKPWVAGLRPTSADHQNIGDVFYESIQILNH
jgi:oligopeptide transport system substrate-binding protein